MTSFSNVYTFSGYAFQTSQEKIMSPNTKTFIDGGQRVRGQYFTIKNNDSTAQLQFSFDGTNYANLKVYESYSLECIFDRYYVKCNSSDSSCSFITMIALKSTW